MAQMIPEVEPGQLKHRSEAGIYRALRDQLDADYTVFHSYSWLRAPAEGEGLREGEIDFVIVHPQRGLLVLEVKGGREIHYDGHRWHRGRARNPSAMADPFDQARRNTHTLLDFIEQHSGKRLGRRNLAFGYAVVFPHLEYTGRLPNHVTREICFTQSHLLRMAQAVECAYESWRGRAAQEASGDQASGATGRADKEPLSDVLYQMLLQDCLMPRMGLLYPVGAAARETAQRLIQLSQMQRAIVQSMYKHPRMLIEGPAGSGKTLLALDRAQLFARQGLRTLFVCFNRPLAFWLRDRVQTDHSLAELRERLVVRHFHGYAAELCAAASIPFSPADKAPLEGHDTFWDDESARLMEMAALTLRVQQRLEPFDALVVDEAQDFQPLWWETLIETLLRDPQRSLIYAFMDPHQSLRGSVQAPPVQLVRPPVDLAHNCRNTQRISVASAMVLGLQAQPYDALPLGEPLQLHEAPAAQLNSALTALLRQLLGPQGVRPEELVLIGPEAKDKGSSLAALHRIDGVLRLEDQPLSGGARRAQPEPVASAVPLTMDASAWLRGEGVLVTTARSFKGLEANIVLLYDLDRFSDSPENRRHLYVACTRARARLIALLPEDTDCPAREILQAAAEASRRFEGTPAPLAL